MAQSNEQRPAFWWITSSISALSFLLSFLCITLAAGSIVFADRAFGLVKQHFGEPASTFPTTDVASFFLLAGILVALAGIYCWILAKITRTPLKAISAREFKKLAWLMLIMHLVLFPLGHAALIVETAFKGPTSEVVMAYEPIAFLALLTMFALAEKWGLHERELHLREHAI